MTITSKEVAEMLGKRHDNLLRAIRKYITQLGEEAPVEVVEEKQDEPQEKAYTVEEVAQILGCSERNVYRNIQSGKLEAVEREVMIPTLKKFVTEEALEKYKAGRAS